jgi:hypothetical protein
MGERILWFRIALAIDQEVDYKAFHNALDKSDRDSPLYAAVYIHELNAKFSCVLHV